MTAQKRETEGIYIGLLHEEAEEQRVANLSAAAKHRIMGHILGLMLRCSAAAAKRGSTLIPPRR